ncbi:hypothetical protein ACWCXX_38360 [Streptomyces sp. NPDC001732]
MNRSKAGKDPSEWMPSAESAKCTCLAGWTATKLRWKLSANGEERAGAGKACCRLLRHRRDVRGSPPDRQSGTAPSPRPGHGRRAGLRLGWPGALVR